MLEFPTRSIESVVLSSILILKSYSTCGVGYGTQHIADPG
ncbi:hypothetical protein LEP1GSC041_4587 [Leptospira noguchii str. 2006001870]|nr:hypothetical protein LEP1GSC041_4587 [Leptospira noguchii str. 2006001870]